MCMLCTMHPFILSLPLLAMVRYWMLRQCLFSLLLSMFYTANYSMRESCGSAEGRELNYKDAHDLACSVRAEGGQLEGDVSPAGC